MKSFMLLLLFAVCALCQNSTNPEGYPFFSPAKVNKLPLGSTASSVITDTNTVEFYYVWVPENVPAIRYTFNVTEDAACQLFAAVNFVRASSYGYTDLTLGFPCPGGDQLCNNWDQAVGPNTAKDFSAADYISDGQYQYVSILNDGLAPAGCSFNLTVEATFECSGNEAPIYTALGIGWACANVTNVTNGQVISKIQSSQLDAYRFRAPQNVSRIWVEVTSNSSNLWLMGGVNWVVNHPHNNELGFSDLGYNDTTGLNYYVAEIPLPYGNYPAYFSVSPSDSDPVTYNISFFESYCGASTAGYGTAQYSPSTEFVNFVIPDCSHPYTLNQLPLVNGTYNFTVPSMDAESQETGTSFISLSIPEETVGYVSLTCVSAISDTSSFPPSGPVTFFSFARNEMATCAANNPLIHCYPGYETAEFISQDLWIGGQWSIAVCNTNTSMSDNVSVIVTALVSTPTPSPSASPSMGASASPQSQSESGASAFLPFIMLIFVIAAALVQL